MIADPRLQDFGRFPPDRCGPFLSSLAHATNVCTGAKYDVPVSQADQFRCPEARLHRKQQQGMIALSHPCRAIRCRQQGGDLARIEERDGTLYIALVGHREDALAVQHPCGVGHRDVAEERTDCGEPGIAAAGAVAARRFGVGEEVGNQIDVDIFDCDSDRWFA